MANFFKFKSNRDSGCLKLVFFAGELKQKPIKYWANVGNIPKHSKLTNLIKALKKQTDIRWGNNITHLAYYSGARLLFPYHVQWMENSFEFDLFSVFGEGRPRFHFTRKVSSNNERFTDDEIKQMNKFMETEYHLIWDSSLMTRKFMSNEKGHGVLPCVTTSTFERTWFNAQFPPKEGGRFWCVVEEQNDLGLSKFQWNCAWNPNDNRWSDNGKTMRVTYYTELAPMPY